MCEFLTLERFGTVLEIRTTQSVQILCYISLGLFGLFVGTSRF